MRKPTDNLITEFSHGRFCYECSQPEFCLIGCEHGSTYYQLKPIKNIFRCSRQYCVEQIDPKTLSTLFD